MSATMDSLFTRRGLLRLGALAGIGTAVFPSLQLNQAWAVQELSSSKPFSTLVHEGKLLVKGGRYDLDTQKVIILV